MVSKQLAIPLTVFDFMQIQPGNNTDLKMFYLKNEIVLTSEIFKFDTRAIGGVEDLFKIFPGIQFQPQMETMHGYQNYGGIFKFNWPQKRFGLWIQINNNSMKLMIISNDANQEDGKLLLIAIKAALDE